MSGARGTLAAAWEAMTAIAKRLVALEQHSIKLRIGAAFEVPAGKALHARELEINGKTVKIVTIEDM